MYEFHEYYLALRTFITIKHVFFCTSLSAKLEDCLSVPNTRIYLWTRVPLSKQTPRANVENLDTYEQRDGGGEGYSDVC